MNKIVLGIFVLIHMTLGVVWANDGVYMAGFVTDAEGHKIDGAKVLITSRSRMLASLRTGQGGWFESVSPIYENSYCNKIYITVIKTGFKVKTVPFEIYKSNKAWVDIRIEPLDDYGDTDELINYEKNVLYGLVENNNKINFKQMCSDDMHESHGEDDQPTTNIISGAVVSVRDGGHRYATVSRESGYFSLYYPRSVDGEVKFKIDHENFNSYESDNYRFSLEGFENKKLHQNWTNWVFGVGGQQIKNATVPDKEKLLRQQNWFGAWVINLAYFPKPLLIKDYSIHHGLSGKVGIDFSVAHSTRLEFESNFVDEKDITTYGVGVVYVLPRSDFLLRFGYERSSADDEGIYLGLSIPFNYIKGPFKSVAKLLEEINVSNVDEAD